VNEKALSAYAQRNYANGGLQCDAAHASGDMDEFIHALEVSRITASAASEVMSLRTPNAAPTGFPQLREGHSERPNH
jgi:hypothetical protein